MSVKRFFEFFNEFLKSELEQILQFKQIQYYE